jgi:hypothetical protein
MKALLLLASLMVVTAAVAVTAAGPVPVKGVRDRGEWVRDGRANPNTRVSLLFALR